MRLDGATKRIEWKKAAGHPLNRNSLGRCRLHMNPHRVSHAAKPGKRNAARATVHRGGVGLFRFWCRAPAANAAKNALVNQCAGCI